MVHGVDDDYDTLEEAVEVDTDDDESRIGSPSKLAKQSPARENSSDSASSKEDLDTK